MNSLCRIILQQRRVAPATGLPVLLFFVGLTVSACGSGGGDPEQPGNLIPGNSTATPAEQLSTEQILRGAATTSSRGLGQRLDDLQQFTDDALSDMDPENPVNGMVDGTNTDLFTDLDTQNNDLLFSSLGVDDPNADVRRTGNTITIDPDEQAVCSDTVSTTPLQLDNTCTQLMADVTVRVEAVTEDSGVLVYLFRESPLLSIGYAPNGVVYELEFGALSNALQAAATSGGSEAEPMTTTATGTLRLEAQISDDPSGDETAELSAKIVNPLVISDINSSQVLLSLQPSTVFQVNTNATTENVTTQVNWGALQVASEFTDDAENTRQLMTSLGGLTGQLSANASGGPLELNNIGIGGVPLNIKIDSVESINLGLDTFGASLDTDTNIITLTTALGLRFVVDNLAGVLDDLPPQYRLLLTANAPAGTGFQDQPNGSTMVTTGGPLVTSATTTDNTQSAQVETTVQQGECFGELDDNDDQVTSDNTDTQSPALQLVPCE